MKPLFATGYVLGAGAAINVQLGWIPDRVEVYNATDGDVVNVAFPGEWRIPFTSGGTNEIKVGEIITGVTSGAKARVKDIVLVSGSWAGGDAAGFFVVAPEDLKGTFQSENIVGETAGATNDATVTVNVTHGYDVDTEVGADNSAVTPYLGSRGEASKGFTIASAVAESGKLLQWTAWRAD